MRLASAKMLRRVVLLSVFLFSGGQVASADSVQPPQALIKNIPGSGLGLSPTVAIVDDEPVALYVTSEGRVALRRNHQDQVLDDETDRPGGRYPGLYRDGDRLYALWWQKQLDGKKHLYIRTSLDKGKTFLPVKIINSETGVLPTYDVAFDGQGRVAVVYHDERKPRYQVYLNRSADGGKTWLDQDIRLDSAPWQDKAKNVQPPFAVEPQIIFHGKTLIVTWKERRTEQGNKAYTRMVSRLSEDGGLNWQPEVEILRGDSRFMTADVLLSHKGKVFLIGFQPGEGLLAYQSSDASRHWKALGALPGSADAAAISQVKVAPQGDNLRVIYTLEQFKKKPQIHLATLSLAEGKWQPETHRVDRGKEYDLTQALQPDLAVLGDQTVVTVWEDYRNIRPNIYLDFSTDGGQTWRKNPHSLEPPGKYASERPSLLIEDDQLLVFFDRFHDDAHENKDYLYLPLSYKAESGLAGLPEFKPRLSPEQKRQKLRERAQQFWQLRVEGKFADTYGFFDPMFRAQFNRVQFTNQQGHVDYHNFDIVDVNVWDNIGGVDLKTTISVPPMSLYGKQVEIESREENLRTEWVWIYDHWYAVFKAFGRKAFLRY